jgi:hypothetical protein
MKLASVTPPSDFPGVRARVPALAVRVTLVVVALALSVVDYGLNGWLAIAICLAVGAAWAPEYLLGWALILFLALGRLGHHAALTWQFLVLLAGVHVLHVLAMLTLGMPPLSWVQPRALVAPLIRFVSIQVPTQALAVVALLLLAPNASGHRPLTIGPLAVIGTVALAGLAVLLLKPRPLRN